MADDLALLRLVAAQRDENAFAELYARYEQTAYSLARYIVGDPKTAEEVLQEAMLRVWSSARLFQTQTADGRTPNLKAWIMKIVARESFKMLRRRKRTKEVAQASEPACVVPTDPAAERELVDALRRELTQLPELERQLIALHFGGGLRQSEISKELALSQQLVSYHISRVLKELRGRLALSGFAALAPLSAEMLQTATCGGYVPAPTLQAGICAALQSRPPAQSVRVAATASKTTGWVLAAILCVCAAAGAGWVLSAPAQLPAVSGTAAAVAPAPPSPDQAALQTLPGTPAVAPELKACWRYTFEQPASDDFKVLYGSWSWEPKQKAMRVIEKSAFALTKITMKKSAVLIKIACEIDKRASHVEFGVARVEDGTQVLAHKYWRPSSTHAILDGLRESRTYLLDKRLVEFINNKPARVLEYDRGHEGLPVVFTAEGLIIRAIEIRALDEHELPAEVKDPSKLIAKMLRIDLLSPKELLELERR